MIGRKDKMKRMLILIAVLLAVSTETILFSEESIERQFEAKYQAWRVYISTPELMIQSKATSHFTCPQFQEIVKLGVPALPYIANKMETTNDQFLWKAIEKIARVKIRGEYDKRKNMVVFPDFPNLRPNEDVYLYWYRSGRKQTPQRFESLYQERKILQSQGKAKEAQDKYQKIKDLGIDALPYIMQKIQQGDKDLIPLVSYLTDNTVKADASAAECLGWWKENKNKWIIPE